MSDVEIKAFGEFLRRLCEVKNGECLDLVSEPGFYEAIILDSEE